jgi:hypothetical protein
MKQDASANEQARTSIIFSVLTTDNETTKQGEKSRAKAKKTPLHFAPADDAASQPRTTGGWTASH